MTKTWLNQVQIIVDEAVQVEAGKKEPVDVSEAAYDLALSEIIKKGEGDKIIKKT